MKDVWAMDKIFLGKLSHWLLWLGAVVLLSVLGELHMHVRHFNGFVFVVLGIAVLCVTVIIATYVDGDRITRQPFSED